MWPNARLRGRIWPDSAHAKRPKLALPCKFWLHLEPMEPLVGRLRERSTLQAALDSPGVELVAVYGRRRIGKTYLVRQFYGARIAFELVGTHGASLRKQLRAFARARASLLESRVDPAPPADWSQAFEELAADLERRRASGKQVLFFDELPWLASRRSGFLQAFQHFWNAWASKRRDLVVVVCGSAAAWMIQKLLRDRGGLHNRVTRRIRLAPFTLGETRDFLRSRRVELGDYQTLELYLCMGGIPHYLKEVRRGESASQAIDRICFSRDGLLRDELALVYSSLFEHSERHLEVIRALAKQPSGLTRTEIAAASRVASGGALSTLLEELEESGFLMRISGFGRTTKDAVFRLSDEYTLFYLRWIERHRGSAEGFWVTRRTSPAWRAWAGLAFEGVCLKHVRLIKRALGIEALETTESAWRHTARSPDDQGAQIDLVIDRKDATVNLCEMKFSEAEYVIDKRYAAELRAKRACFQRVTRTRKTVLLTMVTSYGVKRNAHSEELLASTVEMGALFGT